MADTTGRIPLWIIGTVAGILVIGLVGIFKQKRFGFYIFTPGYFLPILSGQLNLPSGQQLNLPRFNYFLWAGEGDPLFWPLDGLISIGLVLITIILGVFAYRGLFKKTAATAV